MSGHDEERKKLETKINKILKASEKMPVVLLSAFNGHVRFIEQVNKNDERITDWITEQTLTLLNGDPKCCGIIT